MSSNLFPTNETSNSSQIVLDPRSSGGVTPEARLILFLETKLRELGYELVAIDLLNHREKRLSVYIDFLSESSESASDGVTIEDCVRVTHALDEPLETEPSISEIFKGPYELEVSSPGINRPLRKPSDFTKFQGEIARITTFRALTAEETEAPDYSARNPKQKNFYGVLRGYDQNTRAIILGVIPDDGTHGKPKTKPKPETPIRIPHDQVAKANLEREVKGL